jgi:hypothetical protein
MAACIGISLLLVILSFFLNYNFTSYVLNYQVVEIFVLSVIGYLLYNISRSLSSIVSLLSTHGEKIDKLNESPKY